RSPAQRHSHRRSGCTPSHACRGTRRSRPRALPRALRQILPSSSSSLSCCAEIELPCHRRCDKRCATLLRQGDVFLRLRYEGVYARNLVVKIGHNLLLLLGRRNSDLQIVECGVCQLVDSGGHVETDIRGKNLRVEDPTKIAVER